MLNVDMVRAHTPTTTTSYLSSVSSPRSNFGDNRGSGGANRGRTLRSRDEDECSVKTGIFFFSPFTTGMVEEASD